MCALFGWLDYKGIIPKKLLKKLTQALANAAEERGTDAAGISYIKDGKVTVYKRPRAAHLIRFNAPDDTTAIMGHTRMATQGDKKHNYNNHPFSCVAGDTAFAFAHNGVLWNDKDLRKKCNWIEELLQKKDLLNQLRYVGYRFWEEYYACKRSSYYYDTKIIMNEFDELLSELEDAEKEICQQKNRFISNEMIVEDFLSSIHEYIETAYILCCYFIGHYDIIYDSFKTRLNSLSAPIRFYPHILELWEAIHVVEKSYPNWGNPNIFDSFVKIITDTMESFEVYPKDIDKGQSVSIGMNTIKTKREETASKL